MWQNWKFSKRILVGSLVLTAGFLASCGPNELAVQSCADLGSSLAADSGTSHPAFRVIRPNGGEVYHVGDTLHVRVTGNLNLNNAQVKVFVGVPGNLLGDLVPGSAGSRNVFQDCDIAFAIPSVLGVGAIPLVSDFVRIRIEDYVNGPFYFDFSDTYFRILP